ncbi:MAG: hypothetical protein GZ085_03530 [Sulfuriferula multivorans]|uniref:Uncharacterized protein n=1 Tax=Sulfuriferula multivorans TaxID=1559896 RepID=A0A7C9JVV3_9PROT|nr:hypothetical protein [Sulfuriferula multivorans]
MNTDFSDFSDFSAFDDLHLLGENATHPLVRLDVPHKGTPIHYGLKTVWSRMRLPLSLLVAGPGLPPRRFAAATRPDAPSGASNCRF